MITVYFTTHRFLFMRRISSAMYQTSTSDPYGSVKNGSISTGTSWRVMAINSHFLFLALLLHLYGVQGAIFSSCDILLASVFCLRFFNPTSSDLGLLSLYIEGPASPPPTFNGHWSMCIPPPSHVLSIFSLFVLYIIGSLFFEQHSGVSTSLCNGVRR